MCACVRVWCVCVYVSACGVCVCACVCVRVCAVATTLRPLTHATRDAPIGMMRISEMCLASLTVICSSKIGCPKASLYEACWRIQESILEADAGIHLEIMDQFSGIRKAPPPARRGSFCIFPFVHPLTLKMNSVCLLVFAPPCSCQGRTLVKQLF